MTIRDDRTDQSQDDFIGSALGALNLQKVEFARKEGGSCKKKIQEKASKFASV